MRRPAFRTLALAGAFVATLAIAASTPVKLSTYRDFNGTERPLDGVVLFNPDGTVASIGGGGGGGGGGPATIANGADVVEGNAGDAAGASSVYGQLKALVAATAAPVAPAGSATAARQDTGNASAAAAAAGVGGPTDGRATGPDAASASLVALLRLNAYLNSNLGAAVGPLAAGTDYSAQAFRAFEITCASRTDGTVPSATLTLLDGSTVPVTFSTGPTYQRGDLLKSISAIPTNCTFYGRK